MNKLLEITLSQLGVKEIQGEQNNSTIINYAKEAGFLWVNDDETPWCSLFLNWCTQKANVQGSGKANARSWLQTGTSTKNPIPGDVVVYWRGSQYSWTGHVGLFMGYNQNGSHIFTLGGNQGNEVSIAPYSTQQLLGFRKLYTLEKSPKFVTPSPTLQFGNTGKQVEQLQQALTSLGIRVGKIDGLLGFKTKEAITIFQARESLTPDGIYGSKTADRLAQQLS